MKKKIAQGKSNNNKTNNQKQHIVRVQKTEEANQDSSVNTPILNNGKNQSNDFGTLLFHAIDNNDLGSFRNIIRNSKTDSTNQLVLIL